MEYVFDVWSQLQTGWRALRRQPAELVAAYVLAVALSFATVGILAGPLAVSYGRLCLRAARGQPVRVHELFDFGDTFWPALGLAVLCAVALRLGFAFGPLVGSLAALAVGYFALWGVWFMADGETSPLTALALSVRLNLCCRHHTLWLYLLVAAVLQLHPILALAATPLAALALAACYLRLTQPAAGLL